MIPKSKRKFRSTEKLEVRGQKQPNFNRNPKRSTLSKKEWPKTTKNKTAKIQTDKM